MIYGHFSVPFNFFYWNFFQINVIVHYFFYGFYCFIRYIYAKLIWGAAPPMATFGKLNSTLAVNKRLWLVDFKQFLNSYQSQFSYLPPMCRWVRQNSALMALLIIWVWHIRKWTRILFILRCVIFNLFFCH